MNKKVEILAEDIPESIKSQMIIQYGKTFEDVVKVSVQIGNDGKLKHYSVTYKYDSNLDSKSDLIDGMQLLYGNKRSKEYQSAKKRKGVSNEQINRARQVMKEAK
jgi:hypothetical protein